MRSPVRPPGEQVVLLVGGATGTGKSTVASEVAHRLGITRVTSTDSIRETMRAFFSKEFMPSIHYSSFEAGEAALPATDETSDPLLLGFVDQTQHVLVGVSAAIQRAVKEDWSLVLEGVHLVPGMLPPIDGVTVVHCVLQVTSPEIHAGNFWVRDATSEGVRPVERYLDALDEIRLVQDYIVERARHAGVPVVENREIELTIGTVMELVLASVEQLERV